jgi:hypothetical protein
MRVGTVAGTDYPETIMNDSGSGPSEHQQRLERVLAQYLHTLEKSGVEPDRDALLGLLGRSRRCFSRKTGGVAWVTRT